MSAAEQEPEQYIHAPSLTVEQKAVILAHKIPVDSAYPGTCWIACVQYDSVMPTEAELRMIASYIEYKVRNQYNETYQEKIFAKPLPACGGHVTKVFRKGARWRHHPDPDEGWTYRHSTWENSGTWPDGRSRVSLMAVLDRLNSAHWNEKPYQFPEWVKWKADRPDIFPV